MIFPVIDGGKVVGYVARHTWSKETIDACEIRGQVAELSVQIAEKVLKAKLSDDKAQMDMINRLLDEVSSDNK